MPIVAPSLLAANFLQLEAECHMLNESEAETLRRFRAGESVEEIARKRGFVRNTILGHLTLAIEGGAPLVIDQFFTSAQLQELTTAMAQTGARNLTGMRDQLGGRYEIAELRVFRALAGQGVRGG